MTKIKDLIPKKEAARDIIKIRKQLKGVCIAGIISVLVGAVCGMYNIWAVAIVAAVISSGFMLIIVPNEKELNRMYQQYFPEEIENKQNGKQ